MSGLSEVTAARQVRDAAEAALHAAAAQAVADGVPISAVARAADVARTTVYRWIEQEQAGDSR